MPWQHRMHESDIGAVGRPFDLIATDHEQLATVKSAQHSMTVTILDFDMAAVIGNHSTDLALGLFVLRHER
jgi:hypothetical protein